jgi:hypothetical protein
MQKEKKVKTTKLWNNRAFVIQRKMALHYLTKCSDRLEKGEGYVDKNYFRLKTPFLVSGGRAKLQFIISNLRPPE